MGWVGRAAMSALFQRIESGRPLARSRSSAIALGTSTKRPLKQIAVVLGKNANWKAVGRRLHLVRSRAITERVLVLTDTLFQVEVTRRQGNARVWVPAHEEQLENESCEPEQIMVGATMQAAEMLVLEFGRGPQSDSHIACPDEAIFVSNLVGIAIDQGNCAVSLYQNVSLIHVANDHSQAVNFVESGRTISGYANQEIPAGIGKLDESLLRPKKLVDLLSLNGGHEEAPKLVLTVPHERLRPGCYF